MAAASNTKTVQPVKALVIHHDVRPRSFSLLLLVPAVFLSAVVHVIILGLFLFLGSPGQAPATERLDKDAVVPIQAEQAEDPARSDPFKTSDVDPAGSDPDFDIAFANKTKIEDISVPGVEKLGEKIGIEGGAKDMPPISLPAPGGFGDGQGGTIAGLIGTSDAPGTLGGMSLQGMPLPGSFDGRSGSTKELALRDGGGTKASEAAVTAGLQWLARNQHKEEGRWQLDGNFPDKGSPNDIAGTAFGLLPFLAAGKTHKTADDYDKPIEKALKFLLRRQNKKNGDLGGGMYSHGLATIALCEAYGLSKDPQLKKPAQMAVNYIVEAQHTAGGWRYGPGQPGDTSVVGWQVMALKSAQIARLDVPDTTMRKAASFLDSVCDPNVEGYGYAEKGASPTMSAVGLLCRQYLQSWGPQNIRMIKGIDKNIRTVPPGAAQNMYYYYYATQVMHHFGGPAWKEWNDKMRERLISSQVKGGDLAGSWSSAGEPHGGAGGRVMQTSLSLLTLEVYYRHLPLFQRQSAAAAE